MAGFIPRNYTKQQVTVRIDENTLKRVDELAAQLKISRSDLVNQCIEYALDRIEDRIV